VSERLGIWQEGFSKFWSGASDHCACTRREWRWEFWEKADAVKNQFFRHVVYKLIIAKSIYTNNLKKKLRRFFWILVG